MQGTNPPSNNGSQNTAGKRKDQIDQGWIYKWTNYLKGYQKRWFVLSNGYLSYYRNPAEVQQTCRGSINLSQAAIFPEDAQKFMISDGGTQTFHLKAPNEIEKQRWLTAIELARVRAIKQEESEEEEERHFENDDIKATDTKSEFSNVVRTLQSKLADLTTCQDLIVKHGTSLQKALSDIESMISESQAVDHSSSKVKQANERATLFRISTNAMINSQQLSLNQLQACNEFCALAQSHGGKWARMLKHERDQRSQLQEQLELLAKQQQRLETQVAMQSKEGGYPFNPSALSSDDEDVYEDAIEGHMQDYGRAKRHPSADYDEDVDSRSQGEGQSPGSSQKLVYDTLPKMKIVTRAGKQTEAEAAFAPPSAPTRTKPRRAAIPVRPNVSLSLWSIMKNCIGKELSKIPMPVNFNEPLSMLQRLTEDLEYSNLLDRAAELKDSCEQMAWVVAFSISSYSTTTQRTGKPFNPLLGESYEADRRDDFGWRSLAEQVSHHPPAAAIHTDSDRGWTLWQEFTMSSKFRGKYLQIVPLGMTHLEFKSSKNHYTWRKVSTTVHNIIVGRLWIDNHGEMTVENHTTGDKCHLKFVPYSYFSRETPRKVTGVVQDSKGVTKWIIQGTWDDHIEAARVISQSDNGNSDKPVFETETPKTLWRRNPIIQNAENMYGFTRFAIELNEPEAGVSCPTDSRLRPDQRKMEDGDYDSANSVKLRLEEKQRAVRRRKEAEAENAIQEGRPYKHYEPIWFRKEKDQWTNNLIHKYTGDYWTCKEKQDWSRCPDIF